MNILLTGGAGYIGSHTALALMEAGHQVVVYDNLCNSKRSVISRLEMLSGRPISFVQGDILDTSALEAALTHYNIEVVFHFAGLKAVAESVLNPIDYYANNVQGSISLVQAMKKAHHGIGVKTLIFSSSAAVYGEPNYLPLDEEHSLVPLSPYGRTKLQMEQLFEDVVQADPSWQVVSLRYFNPVGAHESGMLGEESSGMPNNLIPSMLQVLSGQLPCLRIFGHDYATPDGTGVRDYIHVMDLADGHLAALHYLRQHNFGYHVFNLGVGQGYSVLEMVQAFEAHIGQRIPYQIESRRPGDIAIMYTKVEKSLEKLAWQAKRNLVDMVSSAWRWQSYYQNNMSGH